MKELLQQYSTYNSWANERLIRRILELPDHQKIAESPSSFNSLHKTVMHMWRTETIWWERINAKGDVAIPDEQINYSTSAAAEALLSRSQMWIEKVANVSEDELRLMIEYQNSKKEWFREQTWQILLHCFNHSTYHRGQIVTMFHQLCIENIPGTDFILWVRSAQPSQGKEFNKPI